MHVHSTVEPLYSPLGPCGGVPISEVLNRDIPLYIMKFTLGHANHMQQPEPLITCCYAYTHTCAHLSRACLSFVSASIALCSAILRESERFWSLCRRLSMERESSSICLLRLAMTCSYTLVASVSSLSHSCFT